MEIDIPVRDHSKIENYSKHEFELAKHFSNELKKELGKFLKEAVLFGSSARKTAGPKSDIDVLLLIDDLTVVVTRDVADAYRIIIQRIISKVSKRLHVVTLRLSAFWDYVRKGDPIGINMLRDGVSLLDSGFFDPLQLLLKQGKIRPSKESIWSYYSKAPATLHNAKWHVKQAVVDLYWAVIDSAHAALMSHDAIPPTPEHVSDMLDSILVKSGKLEKKYSKIMRDFYKVSKGIMHHDITEITGAQFDKYLSDANDFVERMERYIH